MAFRIARCKDEPITVACLRSMLTRSPRQVARSENPSADSAGTCLVVSTRILFQVTLRNEASRP